MSSFQLRHRTFQRFAIRMTGPRVVVTLVLSQFFIHVSGCLIDGRDDCSRRGIRLLAHMNGIRGKAHVALLAFSHFCEADSLELLLTVRGHYQASNCPSVAFGADS